MFDIRHYQALPDHHPLCDWCVRVYTTYAACTEVAVVRKNDYNGLNSNGVPISPYRGDQHDRKIVLLSGDYRSPPSVVKFMVNAAKDLANHLNFARRQKYRNNPEAMQMLGDDAEKPTVIRPPRGEFLEFHANWMWGHDNKMFKFVTPLLYICANGPLPKVQLYLASDTIQEIKYMRRVGSLNKDPELISKFSDYVDGFLAGMDRTAAYALASDLISILPQETPDTALSFNLASLIQSNGEEMSKVVWERLHLIRTGIYTVMVTEDNDGQAIMQTISASMHLLLLIAMIRFILLTIKVCPAAELEALTPRLTEQVKILANCQ